MLAPLYEQTHCLVSAHVGHRPDPSASGVHDGADPRDDADLAGDNAALSTVSHQGSGGVLSNMQPPTATATKSPRERECEDAKGGGGETYEDDNVSQSDEVGHGYSSDHTGEGTEEDGGRVLSDSLATRHANPGQGEEKTPLSPQLPTPTRTISRRAGGDQGESREVRDQGSTSIEPDDGKGGLRFGPSGSDWRGSSPQELSHVCLTMLYAFYAYPTILLMGLRMPLSSNSVRGEVESPLRWHVRNL